MTGTFVLALDGVALEQRFSVYYAINGRIEFAPPWVHSPVRLPITVNTIELDQQTQAAVQRALDRTFPVIRAYGLHKKGIISIANKLPDETLQEEEKLLTLYDLALIRTEEP